MGLMKSVDDLGSMSWQVYREHWNWICKKAMKDMHFWRYVEKCALSSFPDMKEIKEGEYVQNEIEIERE